MPAQPIVLLISIVLAQSAGIIGSIFTVSSIPTWYANLIKPTFSPPNWVFGPVWITLYTLMGISAYLIWRKKVALKVKYNALKLYALHLIINASWSIVFFGLKNPLYGFFTIIILWTLIVIVIEQFHKIDKRAAYLLVPYFLWVSFATALNFAIWILNR